MKTIIILIIILQSLTVYSQVNNPVTVKSKVGIFADYGLNMHNGNFSNLPDIPNCCPWFTKGSGQGISGGVLFEYPILKNIFLTGRAGYASFDGEFKETETTSLIVNGIHQTGEFEHYLKGKIGTIGLEPLISWNLFAGLYLHGGMRGSFQLIKKFEQMETITKPNGTGTFMDAAGNDTYSRTRNYISSDIPNATSILFHIIGGLSYELPLNSAGSLILAPEVFYYHELNPLVKGIEWKVNSIRGGIALKLVLGKEPVEIKEIKIERPIEKEIAEDVKKPDLIASIRVAGVDKNGKEIPNAEFNIEEFLSTSTMPLLNYIFFDENSSEIPTRYILLNATNANRFQVNDLKNSETMEKYHNILNIIGQRMILYPNAEITLIGCNSSVGDEKDNTNLSQKRAEAVKNYLVDVWGIPKNRLKVNSRNLPSKASVPFDSPEPSEENRRVEIKSNSSKILEPFQITDTFRIATPPILRFYPKFKSESGLKDLTIQAYQFNGQGYNNFDTTLTDDIPEKVDWQLSSMQKRTPKYLMPIRFTISATDKDGQSFVSMPDSVPLTVVTIQKKRLERRGDKEYEKFNLILFDFDKADIEGDNKKIMTMVKSKINSDSKVQIFGYTDHIGDNDYNKNLSMKRANNTKNIIGVKETETIGYGEEVLLHDNSLPEGRFYCRTVEIQIENPIK
jgi:outer membrane protein OmpA-like peptidoglycan-associated protein